MTDGGQIPALAREWAAALAQVLESMTDSRPEYTCEECAPAPPEAGDLWWAQPLDVEPSSPVWVGTPRAGWEELGARTLRAAGLDEIETGHARNTWLEILGQSLSMLARAAGDVLHREVNCGDGSEQPPGPDVRQWFRVTLSYPDAAFPVLLGFGARLADVLEEGAAPPASGDTAGRADVNPAAAGESAPAPAAWSRTMQLLLDVELPVSISFGKTQLPMKDVLKLTTGSIIELNRAVSEPVEVLVNQSLVARGEVVVIDGNYGVRIQQIISPAERLRGLR